MTTSHPLEHLMTNLSAVSGMSVEFKRKLDNGSLVDTHASEILRLKTHAQIANTAQMIAHAPQEEKTAWAIELKDYANELYRAGHIHDAMEKYVECITAANFDNTNSNNSNSNSNDNSNNSNSNDNSNDNIGSQSEKSAESDSASQVSHSQSHSHSHAHAHSQSQSQSNVDSLIVPVLCNLSACAIQLKEWHKAARFAEEALALRSRCAKALFRRGIALIHLGEYQRAINSLEQAALCAQEFSSSTAIDVAAVTTENESTNDDATALTTLKEGDILRIPLFLEKARRGLRSEQKAVEHRKRAMEAVFNRKTSRISSVIPSKQQFSNDAPTQSESEGTVVASSQSMPWIFAMAIYVFRWIFEMIRVFSGSTNTKNKPTVIAYSDSNSNNIKSEKISNRQSEGSAPY